MSLFRFGHSKSLSRETGIVKIYRVDHTREYCHAVTSLSKEKTVVRLLSLSFMADDAVIFVRITSKTVIGSPTGCYLIR